MNPNRRANTTVVLITFSFLFMFEVTAQGVFEVKLLKFVNEKGVDQSGKCCGNPESIQCLVPCRTLFRICLTHYQSNLNPHNPIGECSYGVRTTPVLGTNTIEFPSPLHFQFNFTSTRWPGGFTLVIDALGQVDRTSLDSQLNLDMKDVMLSRLVKTDELIPAKSHANSWVTPSPYIHRDSAIHYQYRMVCYKHYYGLDCSTFCEPRDDFAGHYTCDDTGEMVCLPGWRNNKNEAYCSTAICASQCSGHGECIEPDQCKCVNGWKGPDCSQCVALVGCNHGYCTKPYECKCKPGWGGHYCNQDLHYCAHHHPCLNSGICSNTGYGSYSCACPPTYSGQNCEVLLNQCLSNPCKNNGTCQNTQSGFKCLCAESFYGTTCENKRTECSKNPCKNEGSCRNDGHDYTCYCPPGWSGRNCQHSTTPPCSTNSCQNGGVCRILRSEEVCFCKAGFVGKLCEHKARPCVDLMCLNGGTCFIPNPDSQACGCRRCLCLAPYSGSRCEKLIKVVDRNEERYDTRIVVLKEQSLSTSQWIGICFGSGFAVVLLIVAAACLVHYRKKASFPSQRTKTRNPSVLMNNVEEVRVNKVDSIIVVQDNSHRNSLLQTDFSDVSTDLTSWQSQTLSNDNINHETNGPNQSQTRSSAKTRTPIEEQSLRRKSYQFKCEFNADFETTASNVSCYATQQQADLSLPHRSRLPTYEEVCKENNSLVRQGSRIEIPLKNESSR